MKENCFRRQCNSKGQHKSSILSIILPYPAAAINPKHSQVSPKTGKQLQKATADSFKRALFDLLFIIAAGRLRNAAMCSYGLIFLCSMQNVGKGSNRYNISAVRVVGHGLSSSFPGTLAIGTWFLAISWAMENNQQPFGAFPGFKHPVGSGCWTVRGWHPQLSCHCSLRYWACYHPGYR